MPSKITAERLSAMVSQWPVEARSNAIKHDGYGWWSHNEAVYPNNDHAISIHVTSGLDWLLTQGCVGIKHMGMYRVVVAFAAPREPVIEYSEIGRPLIEALHHAIMATAKEGA